MDAMTLPMVPPPSCVESTDLTAAADSSRQSVNAQNSLPSGSASTTHPVSTGALGSNLPSCSCPASRSWRQICHESRFWQVLVVVGVGEVEAAAEEAVEGALGDEGLQVGDPSTVVAGVVGDLVCGRADPQHRA